MIGMAVMLVGSFCAAMTSDYKNSLPKKALCVLFTVVAVAGTLLACISSFKLYQ